MLFVKVEQAVGVPEQVPVEFHWQLLLFAQVLEVVKVEQGVGVPVQLELELQ